LGTSDSLGRITSAITETRVMLKLSKRIKSEAIRRSMVIDGKPIIGRKRSRQLGPYLHSSHCCHTSLYVGSHREL